MQSQRSEYCANLSLQSLKPVLGQVQRKPTTKPKAPKLPVFYVFLCYAVMGVLLGLYVQYH